MVHVSYGSVHQGEGDGSTRVGSTRQSRVAALIGVSAVALLAMLVLVGSSGGAQQQRTVLDDAVDDPMADMDDTPHEWTDTHGDGYDPETQNVWATEDDAFTVPFVGYAKKDLKWRAPAEPETNVLDYLPTGDFTEPKSMKLRSLLGPYPEPHNAWTDITLDY
mmetsp:Transcript_88087/g.128764  ORF Transcript_88087/g.128764 Transcript_88087/m.128764 type:complete len:163 (-) Transcript_88087:287-775(-)|eukprot:CAMPEP_0179435516 /NCGR_PEP_ID=MMETSP0799-20121207/19604_1 /TAXON_ID=46947 /ORGANISM="Geminigera cryophila, Strain CCMP2564" /LENGTH=162 /DNA_ID=CAMNT_0021214921 /DNA_START=49 /DNA_END=537 /DNA_ORIENTATION=-